jgi:DNA-binding transcriptional LysR family regulator
MDRLKALAAFKAVADKGGFSRAAEELDLSCAQVTRSVQVLEEQLGVRLLQRTTRRVSLTSIGEDVLRRAAVLLEGYAELTALGALSANLASGTIRLAAPRSFGRWLMTRSLAAFMANHPRVRIDLRLIDGPLNLCDGEDDLAICQSSDLRPSLIARPIASCEVGLYVASTYLERYGAPETVDALVEHACLGSDASRSRDWRLRRAESPQFTTVLVQWALDTGCVDLVIEAAEHGLGIAMLPVFAAESSVGTGRLRRLLPDWQAEPVVLHLAYHSRAHQPPVLRKLIDHLVVSLAAVRGASAEAIYPHRPVEISRDRVLVARERVPRVN